MAEGTSLLLAVQVALVVLALVVVPRDRRPSSALAWILLVTLVPVLGVLLFAVLGSPKLPPGRRRAQQRMNELIEERARGLDGALPAGSVPPWLPSVARLNETVGAFPLLDGNAVELVTDFEEQLAALTGAVRRAERYVHVEFFVLRHDGSTSAFFDALEDAVRRGVTVRVLLDHLGSRAGLRHTRRELDRIGAQWHLMLPVQPLRGRYQRPDLRNHRKLVVVDGAVGLVGSLNLVHPSYHKRASRRRGLVWRDIVAELHGPVVHQVDAVFVSDWFSETGELLTSARQRASPPPPGGLLCQVAPSGPAYPVENNLALFNSLIYAAQRRLSITTPYFVPDESLLNAITTAARRGVAVELFVSEVSDQHLVFHAQHSYYAELLDAGIRIFEFPAPTILHAKHLSVDEQVAVVSSSNLDIRSFTLDFELSLLVCGRSFADRLRQVEDGYRAVSRELTRQEWDRRGRWHRVADNLARLTSAVQ